jgi:outer membrane protein assembly factor BamB
MAHQLARAIAAVVIALGTLVTAAACSPAPPTVAAATVVLPAYHGTLPTVTGVGIRALWQADWLNNDAVDPVVSGGLVIAGWRTPPAHGATSDVADATVAAVRATTGAPVWAVMLPSSLPDILGLVPLGNVVVVEAGHDIGHAPVAVLPVVTEFLGLDRATGRQLWATAASGDYQQPPVTAAETSAGPLLITGDPTGTVTARQATTGTIAWQAPADCPLLVSGDYISPVALATDGSLITESVACDPLTVIRRLDPATGKPRWAWRAPTSAGNLTVSVSGVARDGAVVLVTGLGAPGGSKTTWHALGLPAPYPWPASLGGPRSEGFTFALDAATGRARWGQASNHHSEWYALTGRAVCAIPGGIQCRDDVTGKTTMPDLAPPPKGHDDSPYFAHGLAVIMSAPAPGGGIAVTVLTVRGGAVTTRARLAVRPYTYDTGQPYAPTVVAAGALPGGGYLILLDRDDRPDTPVLALRLG